MPDITVRLTQAHLHALVKASPRQAGWHAQPSKDLVEAERRIVSAALAWFSRPRELVPDRLESLDHNVEDLMDEQELGEE